MEYYAFLDSNNVVTEVIAGNDDGQDGIDWEQWYSEFRGQTCKKTSYSARGGLHDEGAAPFRKNYAGVGYIYDPVLDAFYAPKPEGNYTLNESTCLWVRNPELGTINSDVIIDADGEDFVTVLLAGAEAGSLQSVSINGEPLEVPIDESGYGDFELATNTPGLITVEWGGLILEVASI